MSTGVSLEFAGLQIRFEVADPRAFELIRAATVISPAVVAADGSTAALCARFSEGSAPLWIPEGNGRARAESPFESASFDAVLRAAMCQALAPTGALIHAAGVVLDEQGILFLPPSEGGKTTISRLLSGRADILSDETICLRPAVGGTSRYSIYGSCFWSGPVYPSRAGGFPLRTICFLRKGPLGVAAITRSQALVELLRELHLPPGPSAAADALTLASQLLETIPSYAFRFPLDADPAPELRKLLAVPR